VAYGTRPLSSILYYLEEKMMPKACALASGWELSVGTLPCALYKKIALYIGFKLSAPKLKAQSLQVNLF
jgi:hypothetical protein